MPVPPLLLCVECVPASVHACATFATVRGVCGSYLPVLCAVCGVCVEAAKAVLSVIVIFC
jgi:hypothetical protein